MGVGLLQEESLISKGPTPKETADSSSTSSGLGPGSSTISLGSRFGSTTSPGSSPESSSMPSSLSPKGDGTNSIAQSTMVTRSTEARSSNLDLNGLVGHVINSLHHAEVESDETQIENFSQSELTALNDHAKGEKNSKKKA